MSIVVALLVVAVGVLVGAFGLGGFLIVPVLVVLQNVPVDQAVAAVPIAFAGLGVVALLAARREGRALRSFAVFLLATLPGALAGAWTAARLPPLLLTWVIALAVIAAGFVELLRREDTATTADAAALPGARQGAAGALGGWASALTGTSGPLACLPLLGRLGVDLRARIRVAQVAQVPISLAAAAGFQASGELPWRLALPVAAALAVGMLVGLRVGARLAPTRLRLASAALLIGSGVALAAKALAA